MVFVIAVVKELDTWASAERIDDLLDVFFVATFTEIGYALYDLRLSCHNANLLVDFWFLLVRIIIRCTKVSLFG